MLSWADCKATCWLLVPGLTARHLGKKNTRGGLTSNQDFFEDDLSTSTNLMIQKTQEGIIFFYQNWECLRMHPAVVHTWGENTSGYFLSSGPEKVYHQIGWFNSRFIYH